VLPRGLSLIGILTDKVIHMWYTGTLLTGIHYGTGQRTDDISVLDSVHAMRVSYMLPFPCLNLRTHKPVSAGGSAS
jgi:hypothetical protein